MFGFHRVSSLRIVRFCPESERLSFQAFFYSRSTTFTVNLTRNCVLRAEGCFSSVRVIVSTFSNLNFFFPLLFLLFCSPKFPFL